MGKSTILDLLKQVDVAPISNWQKKWWQDRFTNATDNPNYLNKLANQFNVYLDGCELRQGLLNATQITYPENLPVSQQSELIKQHLVANQIVIICGETGSGKTTQLPKMLFELGFATSGIIGHTQPRRVAARSLSHRIASELNNPDLVGYKVRFQDKTKATTCIKLMTDGILLQEIQLDRYLSQYAAIIVDEAHERSLNIDFILGYLKTLLPKRPDLKVIVTSATIDNAKLAKFFNQAPVINVAGKTFPVDIIYQPLLGDSEININQAIYNAIESCLSIDSGNFLIFLPGEREIKECLHFLQKTTIARYQLLALFARQNEVEQNLIFQESGNLKIILTTNIAETSLTVPGVKFVIDSGVARIKRYNSRNKFEQLLIEKIAKSSSKQRTGRAGRLSHGMCIRLFSEEDYNLRPEFSDPELLRSNLANVILKLISSKLGDPLNFPFLDRPDDKAFNDGFKNLYQLQAIDLDNQVTKVGQQIAAIPVDAHLAKMLVSATKYNSLAEILVMVAFLAIADPREYPLEFQQQASEKHKLWANDESDFIAILNLWQWYHSELLHKKSKKQLLQKCREHFVSLIRLREWHELHGQLKENLHNLGYKENEAKASYEDIHKALLSGLLNNIGQKDLVENFYIGANGKQFLLHPNSYIKKPKWVVAANLTQTTRLYARVNATFNPEWLVPLTKHLVKYSYSNESWDKNRGEVVAVQSTLFAGLLIHKQKVSFGPVNLELAREIFIKQGIILNDLGTDYKFLQHNRQVLSNLEKLEDKFRLELIIVDEEFFNFYDQILPNDICDIRSFESWLKDNPDCLKINQETFIQKFSQLQSGMDLFPDKFQIAGETIKLNYLFNPDSENDGVTAIINLTQLNRLPVEPFSWLVPGIIRDKLSYIIKSLPKSIRVTLNPVSDFITKFLEQANFTNDLAIELVHYITQTTRLDIKLSDLSNIELPAYLCFHFCIIEGKNVLANGENLLLLKKQLGGKLKQIVNKVNTEYEINDIQTWIPELAFLLDEIKSKHYGQSVSGYLSLVIKQEQVNLTVIENIATAKSQSYRGMLYLIRYQLKEQFKYLEQKQFHNFKLISLYFADIYTKNELLHDCAWLLLKKSVNLSKLPKTLDEFKDLVSMARLEFSQNIGVLAKLLFEVASLYNKVKLAINNHPLSEIIELQLDDLIYSGFLKQIKFNILVNFPRYLQAILKRIDKYLANPPRDMILEKEISDLYNAWYNYVDQLEMQHKTVPLALYEFKYKIEELRVSLFAQELKTPLPVSSKRLLRELDEFKAYAY